MRSDYLNEFPAQVLKQGESVETMWPGKRQLYEESGGNPGPDCAAAPTVPPLFVQNPLRSKLRRSFKSASPVSSPGTHHVLDWPQLVAA
ncbi:hypothetical protein SRHO_G00174500 [Serrasalmus rhombeus]